MMLTKWIPWSALLLVLHIGQGYAGEIMAHGKVVRVVPISAKSQVMERAGDCEPAKPHDAGLAALLAWDLRTGCRTIRRETEVVDGYRVYYEWDDRVYDTVMTRAPAADTIPLRVNVH